MTAIEGMRNAVLQAQTANRKIVIVSTGPMTNVALFVSAYRHLLANVEEFVFMGGGVGQGNRSAVAGEIHESCPSHASNQLIKYIYVQSITSFVIVCHLYIINIHP